ncbi:MAG: nitroreductase/quinone reductase family protein [Chloroflexota bacterium]
MAETQTRNNSGGVPGWVNSMMKFVLRSPLHGIVSKDIMLITFTGRKSGKPFTTPVTYSMDANTVMMFTGGRWWKNLEGGAPVIVRIQGRDRTGTAVPTQGGSEDFVPKHREFLIAHPRDARFHGVEMMPDGTPNMEQLREAGPNITMITIELNT